MTQNPYRLAGFQNGVPLSNPRLEATRIIAVNTELEFGLNLILTNKLGRKKGCEGWLNIKIIYAPLGTMQSDYMDIVMQLDRPSVPSEVTVATGCPSGRMGYLGTISCDRQIDSPWVKT